MCKKKKIETSSAWKNFVNWSIEWVYCHAIKNEIKNHLVDEVKKL